MACAFVRETELEVAKVAVFADLECRDLEQVRHSLHLVFGHRVFYDDDGIVDVSSLDEAVAEKELEFMEEYECPACSDFLDI